MQVYPIEVIENGPEPEPGGRRFRYVLADDARRAITSRLAPFDLDPEYFIYSQTEMGTEGEDWPWAIVMFPGEYPLGGYLARRRQRMRNMPFCSYTRLRDKVRHYDGITAPPLGAFAIRKKLILSVTSGTCPLLGPIWDGLKELEDGEHWICLADPPPADFIASQQPHNDQMMRDAWIDAAPPAWRPLEAFADDELRTNYRLGREFIEAQLWERARDALQLVVAADPKRAEAWHFLGVAQARLGDLAGMEAAMNQAVALAPWWVETLDVWAHAYMAEEQYDRAFRLLEKAVARDTFNEELIFWSIFAGTKSHRYDEVKALGSTLLGLGAPPFCACLHVGLAYYRTGKMDAALELFELESLLYSDNALAWNNAAFVHALQGRPDRALEAVRKALELEPENQLYWDTQGYASLVRGDYTQAEQSLLKALELDPDYPDAWRHIAHTYQRAGRTAKFTEVMTYLESASPLDAMTVREELDAALAIS